MGAALSVGAYLRIVVWRWEATQEAYCGFGGTTSVSSVNQPEWEERTGRSPSLVRP